MKELDVLLERFLDGHERQLAAGAWPEFEALLQSEDNLLWDWLQHPAHAGSAPFRQLLREIRHGTAITY